MAGYPKLWTRIRHEGWFKRLRATQRNIWLEGTLIAKEQTDNGWLCFKNVTHFGMETGCDRGSIEAWLVREAGDKRIQKVEKTKHLLRFYLANYNEAQQVRRLVDLKKGVLTKLNITKLNISNELFEKASKTFPKLDIEEEARKADLWMIANPNKTYKDHDRFFNGWLGRAKVDENPTGDYSVLD